MTPRLMYSKFLLLFIFNLCIACSSYAQSSADTRVNVTISAEVVNSIELITVRTIQFDRSSGREESIVINPVNSGQAGKMIAQGAPGAAFRITFLRERDLVNRNDGEVLFFRYVVSGNSEDDQGTSELLEDDNRALRFNESGQYYIWVGGEVSLQNASPGSYEGEFTLEIEYI